MKQLGIHKTNLRPEDMCGICNFTMIKLEVLENTIALKTYSRKLGNNGRFLIVKDGFCDWLTNPNGEAFLDVDIFSFMKAVHVNDQEISMSFSWLSKSGENLHGHSEYLRLDKDRVLALLRCGLNSKLTILFKERHAPSTFGFGKAQRSLSFCLDDKYRRRALVKALRNMDWWNTHFTMYNDGQAGFGFRTDEQHSICGGLILHHKDIPTKSGTYQCAYYSTHT